MFFVPVFVVVILLLLFSLQLNEIEYHRFWNIKFNWNLIKCLRVFQMQSFRKTIYFKWKYDSIQYHLFNDLVFLVLFNFHVCILCWMKIIQIFYKVRASECMCEVEYDVLLNVSCLSKINFINNNKKRKWNSTNLFEFKYQQFCVLFWLMTVKWNFVWWA